MEDRLRALAAGPKAYMRRRRRIEDLEAEIVQDIRADATVDIERVPPRILKKLDLLNELVNRHNEYFPIEANLPFDPNTGQMLELGVPWVPMPPFEFHALLRAARSTAKSR
jgi:hypothetical protein